MTSQYRSLVISIFRLPTLFHYIIYEIVLIDFYPLGAFFSTRIVLDLWLNHMITLYSSGKRALGNYFVHYHIQAYHGAYAFYDILRRRQTHFL